MEKLNLKDVSLYVEQNIGTFHQKRIQSLDGLKLSQVLKRKNPYLFKAKYVLTAEQIVKGLVNVHISSNEETIFGDWLEGLAIFISDKVYGGRKSGITGIDLEFDSNGIRNIVTIKSGPNWGNSSQIAKMVADFKTAKKGIENQQLTIEHRCCKWLLLRQGQQTRQRRLFQILWATLLGVYIRRQRTVHRNYRTTWI